MKKILLPLTFLFFFLMPTNIYAGDIDITCYDTQSPLVIKNTDPLFNISGFIPGDTNIKTISISNTDNDTPCVVNIYPRGNTNTLGNKIMVEIGNTFNNTLNTFISSPSIQIANVDPNSNVDIPFKLTFLTSSDNNYMNNQISFDFNLGFRWGSELEGEENGEVEGTNIIDIINNISDGIGGPDKDINIYNSTDVLGESNTNNCIDGFKYWWIVLVIQLILCSSLIFLDKDIKRKILISILTTLLGIVGYIVMNRLGCPCSTPWICINHIWLNIGISLVPILSFVINKKT